MSRPLAASQPTGHGNRRRLPAALGLRCALGTMPRIAPSHAPCREPPEAVLMDQDQCRLVLLLRAPGVREMIEVVSLEIADGHFLHGIGPADLEARTFHALLHRSNV